MYGAPYRELLQSYCDRKEWTICDGKTVQQPPPRYRCCHRHQDCRCCEGAGVTECFQPASAIVEEMRMPNKINNLFKIRKVNLTLCFLSHSIYRCS